MSKRNISYIKPREPSFLRKLKEQIGYKEGPTVDTKKQELSAVDDDYEVPDEEPTVVVLQDGDLTADEAAKLQDQLDKEKTEASADLSDRIVFKAPEKAKKRVSSEHLDSKAKGKKSKPVLSFNDEEDDE